MNIFYLDHDPVICAMFHNNKHCVKMLTEYQQILSTSHRVLDGKEIMERRIVKDSNPIKYRNVKAIKLNDDRDSILYAASYKNHPSNIWCRHSSSNYIWLYNLTVALVKEYTHRYGKICKAESTGLLKALQRLPDNIPIGEFTQITQAMPDYCIVKNDSIQSYRRYYIQEKQHLAEWKNREVPEWFVFK